MMPIVRQVSRSRGFTLIELLVVIAVMVSVMAMGAMAMGDFFSQGSFRLGVRAVVNGVHAARQTSIGERCWVFLKLVDTAKIVGKEELPDYIEIYALVSTTDVNTGAMTWKRMDDAVPVEKVELPRNIELEITPAPAAGGSWVTMNLVGWSGILFFPNGSCKPSDDTARILITVLDAVARDRGKVFVYTVTGFVRVRYEWKG
jgi:prepilin-type N-terminal cleavage/methylation domain-containing protein